MITLTCTERKAVNKGEAKQLRRGGNIPYVLYAQGKTVEIGSVSKIEVESSFRGIKKGFLPTTIFTLNNGKKSRKAIVKDIQYKPTNYEIIHLDFLELIDDQPIEVKVPVECVNIQDCVGVKLGGALREVHRHIKVRTLPKHIPNEFIVDIKELDIGKSKKVKDLDIPKDVTLLVSLDEVVVSVIKR